MDTLVGLFIKAKTKQGFETQLKAGKIENTKIVFILDTKEIWTQGSYFPCPYTKDEIDALVENLNTTLTGRINTLSGKIDVLNGTGTGSVSKQVNDAVASIISGAPEAFDTLKEISDWIAAHPEDTTAMNTQINKNKTDIATINDKLSGIEAGAQVNKVTSVAGKTGAVSLAKSDVGLGNVDNTSDANKPVSAAQAQAIEDAKSEIADIYLPTASYTAADVLTKIKSVDGANSGLDADLLDGKQPADLNVGSADKLTTKQLTNEDLNTLKEGGVFYYGGNADVTNAPYGIGKYFSLQVYRWGSSSDAIQIISSVYGIWKRSYDGTTWTAWQQLATTDGAVAKLTTKQLTNEDLNTIKDVNFSDYNGVGGNTCTNKPNGVNSFNLFCFKTADGSSFRQIIWSNEGDYTRSFWSGSWSAWKKMLTENEIPLDGAEGQMLKWVGDKPVWSNETFDESVTESLYGYGVEWNPNVKDPKITRVGNMAFHKSLPIQSQMKGCVAKKVSGAWQVQYYLKEDDWTKKEDGSASRLDGFDGEVMVEIPRFYYKSWDKPNIKRVMISQTKIDSDWIESPKMLVGAYRATVLNTVPTSMGYLSTLPVNSAVSIKNTADYCRGGNNSTANDTYLSTDKFKTQLGKPRTNISRATMRTYARNAGAEMLSYNQYKAVFYWLYVIEYANFNSQATFNDALTSDGYRQGGLGDGVTTVSSEWWSYYNGYYPLIPCGYCDEFGNGTGRKAATVPAVSINSAQTTSLSNYSTGTYTETIDNIPVTKNRWEMTKGASVVITKVNQANTPGIYCGRSTQSGSTVYTVQGLTSGQSIVFYTNGATVATASTNGDITVNWGNSNSDRQLRASFTGACNITISIKSASTVSYSVNGYTLQVPRWRGFDNPFGDIWTNLDGIIIRGNAPDYATATVCTTNNTANYGDATTDLEKMEIAGTEIKQDGYIKTFNLGSTAEIIPNAVGGSTTTYKCDYHYNGSKDASLRTLRVGGSAANGGAAGFGCFYSANGVAYADTHVGFRTVGLLQ